MPGLIIARMIKKIDKNCSPPLGLQPVTFRTVAQNVTTELPCAAIVLTIALLFIVISCNINWDLTYIPLTVK
jgi:hypothetical protein